MAPLQTSASREDVNAAQQAEIFLAEEPPWLFQEEEFMRSRYGTQGTEPPWVFPEEEFMRSRSAVYDLQSEQAGKFGM